ncbi:gfo/Idh/MocA family oxidoreductase [Paenibacillus sp. HJL G12]|uniref:Gfo/Idh/MocA family oxidoreductase n=1 Tax=Paenibacillus dendrobii TaxID=2691084 RepID=A0A7X3LET9_9BACL|nr:Gfo/Idh/MocA family oxidoreductase [Paenibacillus dendrobii]MWV42891.1 gfo/Idh/MocA family oxidoreductase [Paenibacillus dendrobii]
MKRVNVGIIGCGNISGVYFENLKKFSAVQVSACADLDLERAKARAEEFGVPKGCSVSELLADPEIELVVNLTIPAAHSQVCLEILEAGKHVYVEKPLAVSKEEGQAIIAKAKEKGLLVGSAPDTFLGGGIQTCIKLIEDGWIGTPVGATAFMMARGHEHWHPDPEFYYAKGGGPMFDMGPYYLTALVSMLGPIKRIAGMTKISYPERTITSSKKYGQIITVETPTHVAGVLEFHGGAVGTMITSFDVFGDSQLPRIEIYGSQGTLSVPDPNSFGGPVLLRRHDSTDWKEMPLSHGYTGNSRGIGVLDMVYALNGSRINRANGELGYHVLEAMHAFLESSEQDRYVTMTSTCERPQPMPQNLPFGILD